MKIRKNTFYLRKTKKNKIKSCEDYYIYIKNEKEVFRVEVDNFSRKIKNNDDFFEIINKTNILFSFSDKYSVMFEDFSNIIYEISPKCKIILNNKFVSNDQKYWESFKRLKIHNNVNFENINSYMNYIETLIENDSIDTCFTIVLKISSESDINQLIKSLYISDEDKNTIMDICKSIISTNNKKNDSFIGNYNIYKNKKLKKEVLDFINNISFHFSYVNSEIEYSFLTKIKKPKNIFKTNLFDLAPEKLSNGVFFINPKKIKEFENTKNVCFF
jgi:hypothetical protein